MTLYVAKISSQIVFHPHISLLNKKSRGSLFNWWANDTQKDKLLAIIFISKWWQSPGLQPLFWCFTFGWASTEDKESLFSSISFPQTSSQRRVRTEKDEKHPRRLDNVPLGWKIQGYFVRGQEEPHFPCFRCLPSLWKNFPSLATRAPPLVRTQRDFFFPLIFISWKLITIL